MRPKEAFSEFSTIVQSVITMVYVKMLLELKLILVQTYLNPGMRSVFQKFMENVNDGEKMQD